MDQLLEPDSKLGLAIRLVFLVHRAAGVAVAMIVLVAVDTYFGL